MPSIDDRMTTELERLGRPLDAEPDAFDRVASKRARHRLVRRLQVGSLVVAVLAATLAGTYGLTKVFRTGTSGGPRPGASGAAAINGKIAFVRWNASRTAGAIYTMDSDGSGVTRISSEDHFYADLAWSPDGSRLAFVQLPLTSRGPFGPDLYVMNADGTGQMQLTHDATNNAQPAQPAWSPDGSRIAFVASPGGQPGLFVMNADGTNELRLTARPDSDPSWAEHGAEILFVTSPEGRPEIQAIAPDGSNDHVLAKLSESDPGVGDVFEARWSPDGMHIAFVLVTQNDGHKNYEIYVMNADGTHAVNVTNTTQAETDPVWSPDGKRLAFVRDGQIYSMNADGSEVIQLTHTGSNAWPAWQRIPGSEVPTVPSPKPTASAGPSSFPGTGALPAWCDPSTVTGDFDADGLRDTATVGADPCLQSASAAQPKGYSLSVQWGNGASGSVTLGECQARQDSLAPGCRAQAASDLNGDGHDEFILQVENGPTFWSEIYELAPTEPFGQQPVTVAPPGTGGFPAGKSFVVLASPGFGVASLTCETAEPPLNPGHPLPLTTAPLPNRIIVGYADISNDQTTWQIKETVFVLDPDLNAPWGQVSVVSTDTRTAPVDPSGGGPKFEGQTCPGMKSS